MKQINNLIIFIGILIISILPVPFCYSEAEQIITNWSYPHYQDNQLVWEAKGKTAVISEDKMNILSFELTYYLQPITTTETTKKEKVIIKADMAGFDKQKEIVTLHENIIVKRVSEPADELDETMQTGALFINLTNKTFSTDAPITVSRSDLVVKSKGCKGDLYFNSVSFAGDVETVIKDCTSNSFSLGAIFFPKPHIDSEDLNKISSVITITSEGPLSVEKTDSQPSPLTKGLGKKTAQRITLQNKVKVNSFLQQSPSPSQIKLQAENLILLLARQENPVTKRNSTYLINLSATDSVKIDDSFQSAECFSLVYDEVLGFIILKGNEKSLATIIKPLKPISNTVQTKNNSHINLSAQTIKIQTEKDKLLLMGRKEIVFSDGSIYNSSLPISGTEVAITNTPTTSDPPPPSSNGKTSTFSNKIQITADNNALVSFNENQIYLENKVRIFQKVKTSNSPQEVELKTRIDCDRLTINWNSSENSLQRIRAENNVIIDSAEGGRACGEFLEWAPDSSQINLKSPHLVKIWYKNSLLTADEIIITTNPQIGGYIGDWNKIETKNKGGGVIKVNSPEKDH